MVIAVQPHLLAIQDFPSHFLSCCPPLRSWPCHAASASAQSSKDSPTASRTTPHSTSPSSHTSYAQQRPSDSSSLSSSRLPTPATPGASTSSSLRRCWVPCCLRAVSLFSHGSLRSGHHSTRFPSRTSLRNISMSRARSPSTFRESTRGRA